MYNRDNNGYLKSEWFFICKDMPNNQNN